MPSRQRYLGGYFPIMNTEVRARQSMSGDVPVLPEDDPEFEHDFRDWAQLLLDVYLWKLQQERNASDP